MNRKSMDTQAATSPSVAGVPQKHNGPEPPGLRCMAMIAAAIGAVAVGGFAIGALAIGRLVIRGVAVESAKFKSLEIQDLKVTRLHAAEVTVSGSLKLPGSHGDDKSST